MHAFHALHRGRPRPAVLGTVLILAVLLSTFPAPFPASGLATALSAAWISPARAETPPALELTLAAPGGREALEEASRAFAGTPEHGPLMAAVSAAVTGAGVDPGLLAVLLSRSRESGYPGEELVSAVQRLHRVSARGLPVLRMVSRYVQGMAKGVPADRIEGAVSRLEGQLKAAATLVDAAFPDGSLLSREDREVAIDHAASAIQAGADEGVVRRSLAMVAGSEETLTAAHAPLFTLGILVASGVGPDRSLDLVANAWDHGIRGGELERLGKTVGSFSRNGEGPPAEVLDQILEILERNRSPDLIFEGLDNLDRGFRDGSPVPGFDPSINRKPGEKRPVLDEPHVPAQSEETGSRSGGGN